MLSPLFFDGLYKNWIFSGKNSKIYIYFLSNCCRDIIFYIVKGRQALYKEQYKIIGINEKDRWISIRSKSNLDLYDSEAFNELLNIIAKDINGDIVDIGDFRYKIKGDRLDLTYQWDGVLGLVLFIHRKAMKQP